MVRLGFFAHMSPVDGKKTPVDRARAEGELSDVAVARRSLEVYRSLAGELPEGNDAS